MDEKLKGSILHLAILLGLIIALVVVLVYTGLLSCGVVPGGCELYYQFIKGGPPQVLIAYNDSGGLGNPVALAAVLSNRELLSARVKAMPMDRLTNGNIGEYDMVIVESARKICTSQLNTFMYYVNTGGRLVWTGDAGTVPCEGDELLKDNERNEEGKDQTIGSWARKDEGGKQVNFDEFLGASYIGNRCSMTECRKGELAGFIEVVTPENRLVYGLSPTVPFHGDFSVVQLNDQTYTRLVAALDYGSDFIVEKQDAALPGTGQRQSLGRKLPFIVSSQVGDRVAYYAAPIESFVSDEQPQKYKALVEQMYYGMLYK
ncbi:Uncharacterised protein [uncultured archaeon]|nr:Uncharacterised protein [uncultured archaeon]